MKQVGAKSSSTRKAKSTAEIRTDIYRIRRELVKNGQRLDKAAASVGRAIEINDWLIDLLEGVGTCAKVQS